MGKKHERENITDTKVNTNHKELTLRSAEIFDVIYRRNNNLQETEQDKIIKAVKKGGVAIGSHTYVDKEVLPTILDTDKKGAAIAINEAAKDEIKEVGGRTFMSTPEISKDLARRIEEPRPALQREKLKQARDNIEDFSQNPQLEKERSIASDRINKCRKTLGKETIKRRNSTTSDLSKKPLKNPEVHHIYRVADCPEKVNDDDNLVVLNSDEHEEFHKSKYLQNRNGFDKFKQDYEANHKDI